MLTRPQLHRFLISKYLTLVIIIGIILALLKQASLEREMYCVLTSALWSATSTYSAMQAKTLSVFIFQFTLLNFSHFVSFKTSSKGDFWAAEQIRFPDETMKPNKGKEYNIKNSVYYKCY